MAHSKVIIIDYGSQVTQLIARRVREASVYSEIHACNVTAAEVAAMAPSAIILSGGPASVGEADAPTLDKGFLELGVPVLGICYGMQLLAQNLGGELLTRMADLARARGGTTLLLDVVEGNLPAIRLYEQCGYERRPAFAPYVDDPLSLFMEKALVVDVRLAAL